MTDLEKKLLAELECPICTEYLFPPIRQCTTGHCFCTSCFDKLEICPTCRSAKGVSRAYTLEKLHAKLNFPCKYRVDGCFYEGKGDTVPSHEAFCPFSIKPCPLKHSTSCGWSGRNSRVIAHCKQTHPQNVFIANSQTLTCPNFRNLNFVTSSSHILIQSYGELFKLVWQIASESGLMTWCVYHLGFPGESKRYSYEIIFNNSQSDKEPNSIKASCEPVVDERQTFCKTTCMLTHFDMLSKFCNDRGDLVYTVNIYDNTFAKLHSSVM